ncbi:MAG: hypothetical protein TR69_WS6001001382 [candidate division WS6 bacterium OLB20]|uniref:DUF4145 domain-containing protein n=1 Tax=candidate division WS6 bacterium OLB20 TaxID=1617426 RepID=A0A136LWR4_9BACT|nr:MAG: hypothetical protein TR69_WS6001001382 [candidate division WS6 bacterium OLB20]
MQHCCFFFAVGVIAGRSKPGWKASLQAEIVAAGRVKSSSRPEAVAKLVLMDALFDKLLKNISTGDTMGMRLKNAKGRFSREDYNRIWESHKLRNVVVHEPGNTVGAPEINSAAETLAAIAVSYLKH